MNKYAAVAAIAAFALTGCATAAQASEASRFDTTIATLQAGWDGTDAPTTLEMEAAFIDTCKALTAGVDAADIQSGDAYSDRNSNLIIDEAGKYGC